MRLNVLSLPKINHFPCDQGIKTRPLLFALWSHLQSWKIDFPWSLPFRQQQQNTSVIAGSVKLKFNSFIGIWAAVMFHIKTQPKKPFQAMVVLNKHRSPKVQKWSPKWTKQMTKNQQKTSKSDKTKDQKNKRDNWIFPKFSFWAMFALPPESDCSESLNHCRFCTFPPRTITI